MKILQRTTVAIAALGLMAGLAQAKTDKPNILIIWADDMGPLNLNNTIPVGL